MGSFAIGDIVTVTFPYADLSAFKKRPALIIGQAEFGNYITCQITSKATSSKTAIKISDKDFSHGGLQIMSYIRPDKIFTLEPLLIQAKAGSLTREKLEIALVKVRNLFQ